MSAPSRVTANSTIDIERRFSGVRRLYGQHALQQFRQAHVTIIGIGGVGSWAAEALARTAIGRLTLIDMDHVAESNINRQLPALSATLGMAKVQVMAERIRQINPACRVDRIEEFLTVSNISTLLAEPCDYVIDCVDSFRIKAALIAHCKHNRIRLITVGAAGGQIDPTRIRIIDLSRTHHDALLSRTRKLLRADYRFPKNLKRRFDIPCVYSLEQPVLPAETSSAGGEHPGEQTSGRLSCAGSMGSAMSVTAAFGLAAAAHVLKKLKA